MTNPTIPPRFGTVYELSEVQSENVPPIFNKARILILDSYPIEKTNNLFRCDAIVFQNGESKNPPRKICKHQFLIAIDKESNKKNCYPEVPDYEEIQRFLKEKPFIRISDSRSPSAREIVQALHQNHLDPYSTRRDVDEMIDATSQQENQILELFREYIENKSQTEDFSAIEKRQIAFETFSQYRQIQKSNIFKTHSLFLSSWAGWHFGVYNVIDGGNPFSRELLFSAKQLLKLDTLPLETQLADTAVRSIISNSIEFNFDSRSEIFTSGMSSIKMKDFPIKFQSVAHELLLEMIPVTATHCMWVTRLVIGADSGDSLPIAFACGWIEKTPSFFKILCRIPMSIISSPLTLIYRIFRGG